MRRPTCLSAAMAMEIIIGPAPVDGRTPVWAAKDAADDGTGDRARRPRDHQTGARAGRSADHVGARL